MIYLDEPIHVKAIEYDRTIDTMVELLSKVDGVKSVYQIGGISAPGISDIDLVVIFEDGVAFLDNPREELSFPGAYLFNHNLLAAPESLFRKSNQYVFFHNYKLLYGNDQQAISNSGDSAGNTEMYRQLAKEYLVRMLLNLMVEREFGFCKLRTLLLQGKALHYDLEFLDAQPELLQNCIHQIIKWREIWFEDRPSNTEIKHFYGKFWIALINFLDDYLPDDPLFLPARNKYSFGKNIQLFPSPQVSASSIGPKLPWVPRRFARKLIALQHRFNRFTVKVPIQTQDIPNRVGESFEYTSSAAEYNRLNLPHFMPLTSSLVLNS